MKKIILFCLLLTCFLAQAQNDYRVSIAPTAGYMLKDGFIGEQLVLEDSKFQMVFGAGIDQNAEISIQIKPSLIFLKDGKSRFMVSPLWLKGGDGNLLTIAHGAQWTRPFGKKSTFTLGVDVWVDQNKPAVWPAKSGEFGWMPSATYRFDLIGNSYGHELSGLSVATYLKQLKPTKWDYIALSLLAVDGVARGAYNARYADQKVFEKKFKGISATDFGGSKEDLRKYIIDEDGTIIGMKSQLFGNFGRDSWHTLDDIGKWAGRLGASVFTFGLTVDIYKFKKHPLASITKGIAIAGISSGLENMTYHWLRQ